MFPLSVALCAESVASKHHTVLYYTPAELDCPINMGEIINILSYRNISNSHPVILITP